MQPAAIRLVCGRRRDRDRAFEEQAARAAAVLVLADRLATYSPHLDHRTPELDASQRPCGNTAPRQQIARPENNAPQRVDI